MNGYAQPVLYKPPFIVSIKKNVRFDILAGGDTDRPRPCIEYKNRAHSTKRKFVIPYPSTLYLNSKYLSIFSPGSMLRTVPLDSSRSLLSLTKWLSSCVEVLPSIIYKSIFLTYKSISPLGEQ